ncbi:hypothetical protein BGZ63DRAFT_425367 [Mariannaea sp. PMI_226]|nr:hypothetical protein BGZ63DRAFT_425367 [Mariannaea sp. PMI_226]
MKIVYPPVLSALGLTLLPANKATPSSDNSLLKEPGADWRDGYLVGGNGNVCRSYVNGPVAHAEPGTEPESAFRVDFDVQCTRYDYEFRPYDLAFFCEAWCDNETCSGARCPECAQSNTCL